jgi:FMN phosphatase YigB (HAD superfamily)
MLIFDFDGVLINSIDEVVLTAYNATTGNLHTTLTDLPTELVSLFKRNRFHIQPIGDAILMMQWCLNNYQIAPGKTLTPQEYQRIIADATVALKRRSDRIYKMRSRFIEKDQQAWMALHRPYQPLWNQLISIRYQPLVILTNKNKDATLRLCRFFDLNVIGKNVYPGDHGLTKSQHMHRIRERFEVEKFYFIDDSVKNLKQLDEDVNRDGKALSLMFATWGYTGPDDLKLAESYGYPVFSLYAARTPVRTPFLVSALPLQSRGMTISSLVSQACPNMLRVAHFPYRMPNSKHTDGCSADISDSSAGAESRDLFASPIPSSIPFSVSLRPLHRDGRRMSSRGGHSSPYKIRVVQWPKRFPRS